MKNILTLQSGKQVVVLVFGQDEEVYAEVFKSAFENTEELDEIKALLEADERNITDVRVIAEVDYNNSDAEQNQ